MKPKVNLQKLIQCRVTIRLPIGYRFRSWLFFTGLKILAWIFPFNMEVKKYKTALKG